MKPRILICSDSARIDTGFARVAREIGSTLALSGHFEVAQHGWYDRPTADKLVPFRIYQTERGNKARAEADQFGQHTFDEVATSFKPDLVLTIGDPWMVDHIARRPRNFKLVGYHPIDSVPIPPQWLEMFAAFDVNVMFGQFGASALRQHIPEFPCVVIPHGVDTEVFRPIPKDDPGLIEMSKQLRQGAEYLVGCVARNTGRKNLPRLMKTFKRFISPWAACKGCGRVSHEEGENCPYCGDTSLRRGPGKDNARLYLHCDHEDPHGYKLGPLVHRLGLAGKLGIPYGMRVGSGCTDADLNLIYNAMDLFTLPTTGEGFGLPIAEAMSAGTPVLVTNYSGHMDYVAGAGATIEVSEFETFPVNNCERAIVDMDDYEMKLDQFYMGPDQFWDKWGMFLERQGLLAEQRSMVPIGLELSRETGRRGAERIREHYDWKPICQKWLGMICSILKYDPNAPTAQTTNLIPTEVIQ